MSLWHTPHPVTRTSTSVPCGTGFGVSTGCNALPHSTIAILCMRALQIVAHSSISASNVTLSAPRADRDLENRPLPRDTSRRKAEPRAPGHLPNFPTSAKERHDDDGADHNGARSADRRRDRYPRHLAVAGAARPIRRVFVEAGRQLGLGELSLLQRLGVSERPHRRGYFSGGRPDLFESHPRPAVLLGECSSARQDGGVRPHFFQGTCISGLYLLSRRLLFSRATVLDAAATLA